MGIKFGEIDSSQILKNEFRIGVLEGLIDFILANNANLNKPTNEDIRRIKRETIEVLRNKYPNSGISLSEK